MTTSQIEQNDNWVRVFISHKEEDKGLALATRSILEEQTNNLRCYVSGSAYGIDWLNTIKSELRKADVFLLLYTSPAKKWDWPLFEVGYFTPINDDRPNRSMIYLYSGEHRPAPLKHLHGVRINQSRHDDIEKFLLGFYKTTEITGREPPLLPRIDELEISSRAKKLTEAFMMTAAIQIYPTYRLVLRAPAEQKDGISSDIRKIPLNCCVEKITPSTLSIFGRSQKPNTWGELLNIITEDVEWKEELDEQFWNSISGQLAYPTGFTFRGVQDGRNFRAMITRIECADTKISRISIVFIPEHKPAKIGGLAFNLLSFSTRFKYEVINTFFGKLDEKINKNGEEQTFCNLLGAIRNIEREADQFGIMDPDTVKTAFSEKGKDRDTVTEMFKIWGPLRDEIFLCAKRKDASDMERLLGELRVINAEFIRMVTRRHCELIEDDVSTLLDN